MLWAGSEDPSTSKLSISQNNSTNNIKIEADLGTTPIGSIVMWYSTAIPTGWMECNGQSTDGYTELKAIVGNTVPNFNGRFPLGRGGTIGAALGATGGATTYAYGVAAHSHDMGSLTNETNLANVSTAITEGTLNAFNVSITEGSAKANTGNHSHGVTGNSSANTATLNAFFPNSGTLRSFSDDSHTHADGNYTTNSYGGDSGGSHTHSMNAFTGSVTEGTMNSFSLSNSGVAGDTLGINSGSSTANITSVIPPYLGVIFIIYHGVG
jgi:microcystin-dependent protein